MKTEAEARKCWCPFVKLVIDLEHYASGNRFMGPAFDDQTKCIASECMVWRWGAHIAPSDSRGPHSTGYCGLADKP